MKYANSGAKDGAIILLMGLVLGMFLAFVLHEYGDREAKKASGYIDTTPKPPKPPTPPQPYFDGKNFIKGKTA